MMMKITLRKAGKNDIPEILALIRELATYERAPQEVTVTAEDLEKDGFGDNPAFEVLLAFNDEQLLGMAFYYFSYSTWKGKCLYLEDIIVKEQFRGNKAGKLLFEAVIKKARETGAKRMHWQVLEWNEPAINFYKKYGAVLDETWTNGKFTEEQLAAFKL
ncbi:MAG TPA: GNAT family N-acetyltransferase [Bacteroidales bacterium]|jgi:GNAT superfamily N-acetyltransferase|nr:GNAT family N-acetyltransferase [Bacteroidales bacterium]HOH84609.1 GNAT family N-acetyltransferase [Bacteroidales bacterium]HPB26510.1 GNAT family N-acetyltransferase [Bacteroidales bacterium]HPI31480.1 GNAT family N-acetyltransferase [Bacteroidales bacterium]HQN17321.1 GNAT family N-acetyltransferase [Bacteroidales bacterium]